MNKHELIDAIANETGEKKVTISLVVDSMIGIVKRSIENEEKISISGFGSFDLLRTKERQGRNPVTGDIMKIEATARPKFTPAAAFRESVRLRHKA